MQHILCSEFIENNLHISNMHKMQHLPGNPMWIFDHKYLYESNNNIPFHNKLMLETSYVTLYDKFFIPSIGHFYNEDSYRSFIKVPIDKEDSISLRHMLSSLDNKVKNCTKDIIKAKFPTKNFNTLKFNPIVRIPHDNEESDSENENNNPKYNDKPTKTAKFNFKLDYDTKNITSLIFVNEKQVLVSNITELLSKLHQHSKVRFILSINKIWCKITNHNHEYGIKLQIEQLDIIPYVVNNIYQYSKKFMFKSNNMDHLNTLKQKFVIDDSEDEDDDIPELKSQNAIIKF